LLASLNPCDYDAFLGPPSPARLAAFWALATYLTKEELTVSIHIPSPKAQEACATLRWRDRDGRWRSFGTLGGGTDHTEAIFHATFFALRRYLLGDVAVTGVIFSNSTYHLELCATEPLLGLYGLMLSMLSSVRRN
jgi:hypothetical protein